jgi:hypothetical protein
MITNYELWIWLRKKKDSGSNVDVYIIERNTREIFVITETEGDVSCLFYKQRN